MNEIVIQLERNGAAAVPGGRVLLGYAGNRGNYRLRVEPRGEWEGLTIRAHWHTPGGTGTTLVQNGLLDVPEAVTAVPGNGCITFEGTDGERTVTSADVACKVCANSGTAGGDMPQPGTPAWEAFIKEVQGMQPGPDSPVTGIPGAAADGETDDTEALVAALSQSNCVVDGGNKRYHYGVLELENVENLTVRNVTFWRGEAMNVKGCRNIRFEHCRWEGVRAASDASETWTCGIRLMERTDEDGNETWCENIWIEGCIFDDIDFNHNINIKAWGPCGNEISGQAILPRSVHNLFIKNNVFTQTKGNAAIHWNTYKKCGYAEITDNLFYLLGFGAICVYAVQQQFPKVSGRICDNQFIGCGLGYEDPDFLNARSEKDRGVGCAALLGGAGTNAAPYKWHFAVENNVFEDCVESSIEGPVWNPVVGNYIDGQGALQDEENCRQMEQKYRLPYKLEVRYNPSVNFIYRNYYKDVDGTYPMDDDDPMLFASNVMGKSYVDRASFIQLKGDYNCPVVFIGNAMQVDTGSLHTHLLFCTFRRGVRFENNQGILPYFNQCTVIGDLVLDDALSAWGCDFSQTNFVTNNSRARFPETRTALYDPGRMILENDQANVVDGYPVLTSYDVPEAVEKPTDTAYDIKTASGYTAENGYAFGGPSAPNHIDTGIQLLKDGGDFTIFLQFDGNSTTAIGTGQSPIMPLFTVYNASGAGVTNAASYRCTVGGQWGNIATAFKRKQNITSLNSGGRFTLNKMQLLLRRKGAHIEIWSMLRDTTADSLSENCVTYDLNETDDQFAGFTGTLYLGAPDGYFDADNKFALWGSMKAFQLFERALTDNEVALLLYNRVFASADGDTPADVPVYDITKETRYDAEEGAVIFDGTENTGIDTGRALFADSNDFTVICNFRLENYHDVGLKNFSFIPVLSCMKYDQTDNFKTKSPGFDIGLSMQLGTDMDSVPTGGFVNFRNSWKFSGGTTILNSYFGYADRDIGVIVIRRNGTLSVYDFNMQRLATLTGADATTVFDGTLRIGANLTAPSLGGNYTLQGKVYDCRIYDKALPTSTLETMFPNLYSNEVRTKGMLRCLVPSLQYTNQSIRYVFLEANIDMGKYSSPEYVGKYPKAVGIRLENADDIIWCPTGSNTHIRKALYLNRNMGPYSCYKVDIVNTGLAPGLEATVKAFRCAILTQDLGYTETSDALGFAVEWDKEELTVGIGETLTGRVTYQPEGANTGTSLTVTVDGAAATAEFEDDILTVTGVKNGEATVTATLPSGMQQVFHVTVGTGIEEKDPVIAVESVSMSSASLNIKAPTTLTATVLPANATNRTVTWSVEPEGVVSLSATTGDTITLTPVFSGTATVTASAGGKSGSCAVTAYVPPVTVDSVSLNATTLSLNEERSYTLTATVLPENAADKTVTWSVTPEKIVELSATTGSSISVTGITEGTATVIAMSGGRSASCVVIIKAASAGEVDDVSGETPVYKLPAAKTFVPANQECIDTGIQMFTSIDPKPSYTILFEVQYGENVTAKGDTWVLLHCMEESSPWPGFVVQVVGDGGLQTNIYGGKAGFGTLTALKEKAYRYAVRISGTTATRWQNAATKTDFTISNYNTTVSKNLILGCYQQSNGAKGRFFDGTLYQCLVYNKALTDEQIETWLKG